MQKNGNCEVWCTFSVTLLSALSALTPLVGWQEGHPACKNWVLGCWRGCLQRGADLHMAQLMPLLLNVSCFSKIPVGFTFLILAHPSSPRQRAVEWVCVCVVSAVMTQEVFLKILLHVKYTWTCIWPRWCHCHSPSLAWVKSRFVLPFWYWLTRG